MSQEHHHPHRCQHSKIEAVTVCVGYADFLEVTVKLNQHCFDRWVIVTAPDDHETREVCRKYNLYCLLSEDHHRDSDTDFNKGRLIERGLQHLSKHGWRIHIDADILLPPNFRNTIETSHLDTKKIYGVDRVMVQSRKDWEKLKDTDWLHAVDYHCRLRFPKVQVGTRWCHHSEGYVPIGFFQMWHSDEDIYKGARIKPYPIFHNDACRTDVQHSLQWDRQHRALIPEVIAVHLESGPAKLGANWNGRTTKRF